MPEITLGNLLQLLSLAAAVRRDIPDARIEVWDCPANRWGWRTLAGKPITSSPGVLVL